MRQDNTKLEVKRIKDLPNGGKYLFRVKIPHYVGWIDHISLVIDDLHNAYELKMNHVANDKGFATFEGILDLQACPIYRYYYKFIANNEVKYITASGTKDHVEYDDKNKMSVGFKVPEWAKGAVYYHVFVDSFCRGSEEPMEEMPRRQIQNWEDDVIIGDNKNVPHYNEKEEVWNVNFHGGDIKGVIKNLDYIESLGVNIIYLSPIVKSQSNHRYDTADYFTVDPYAGSKEDIIELCNEAHKRGMKVILDGVFNHVGDESIYFDRHGEYKTGNPHEDGAFNNPESKYKGLFQYEDINDPKSYKYWWGIETMPQIDATGKTWRDLICGEGGVIDTWFSWGIDGLRLDVPENIANIGLVYIHEACVRNKPDALILGEYWHDIMRHHEKMIDVDKMQTTMNYYFTDALDRYIKYQDPTKLEYTIRDIKAEYPTDTILTAMNSISTHDNSRKITLFAKRRFDTYGKFRELPNDLQYKIYDTLRELGYDDLGLHLLFTGEIEMDYYKYNDLMWNLGAKGVPVETVNYLKSILSFSPFKKDGEYTKSLYPELEKNNKANHEFYLNYILTNQEYEYAKMKLEEYAFILYNWEGAVSLFYGDEAGIQGLHNEANRRTFPWGHEDKDLTRYFQRMGAHRNRYPFLRTAHSDYIELKPEYFTFETVGDSDKMFVAINNTDEPREVPIPLEYRDHPKVLSLRKSNKDVINPHGGIAIKK